MSVQDLIEKRLRHLFKGKDEVEIHGQKFLWSFNPSPYLKSTLDSMSASDHDEIVFHGTSSTTSLNSILQHGFLLPGDLHPFTGYSLKMQNGESVHPTRI